MANSLPKYGVQIMGTDAVPCTFGATGSATDVMVFTHNYGFTAEQVNILTQTHHQQILTLTLAAIPSTTSFTCAQTVNAITVTNVSAGILSVLIWINWQTYSPILGAPLPGYTAVIAGSPTGDTRIVYS